MGLRNKLESAERCATTNDKYVDANIVDIENRYQAPMLNNQYIDWEISVLVSSEDFSLRECGGKSLRITGKKYLGGNPWARL